MKAIQKCLFMFLAVVLVLGMFAGSQAQAAETTAVREGQYNDREGWGFAAGLYEVDGRIAYCCQHAKLGFASCPVTVTTIEDARIAKALYYGWGGPKQWSGFKDKADGVVVTALVMDHYYSTPTMSEGVEYLCKGFLAFLDTQPAAPSSKVYLYVTGSDSLQNLVGLPKEVYETAIIEIYKTGSDGKKLAGAEFLIKDSSGNNAGKIVTNSNGYGVSDQLEFGTYTVEETKFPDGYGTSSDTTKWTVTLNADTPNGTVTINAVNTVSTGKAMIIKDTTNGGDKSGWAFGLYTDAECTDRYGPYHYTNSDGVIVVDLEPGTYYVKEIGNRELEEWYWDDFDKYWICDERVQKVTVKAGETATVTFTNQFVGAVKIVKDATNGGTVAGWPVTLYTDKACTNALGTYTTNKYGYIYAGQLEPGTYYAKETGAPEGVDTNDWIIDEEIKEVTVTAGETAIVTFTNQYNPKGKAEIIKYLDNDGETNPFDNLFNWSLEGWKFELEDEDGNVSGPYTTDENGKIVVDLEPGTYYVTELLDETSPWFCESNMTQKITVKAGQTATVQFYNALKPGTLKLHKLGDDGKALAGAKFLLEYSYDGTNWEPVWWNDEYVPGEGGWLYTGGCSNEEVDGTGCLTTDENGVAVFDGLWPTLYYRLTELSTPNGYQLSHGVVFEGTLATAPDFTILLESTNDLIVLPMTGSYDFWLLPVAVAGVLISAYWLVTNKKNREQ